MYAVIVYDVNKKRVARILKYLRRHLHWIQNSVFEGEVTPAQMVEIKSGLRQRLKLTEDSVYFFTVRSQHLLSKETLGRQIADNNIFI
jgi:CRISPR-associated protein Cas2